MYCWPILGLLKPKNSRDWRGSTHTAAPCCAWSVPDLTRWRHARLLPAFSGHGLHQRPHVARKAKPCELPRSTHHQRPADAAKRFALPKTPLCTPLSVLFLYSDTLRVVSQDGDYKACCTQPNRDLERKAGTSPRPGCGALTSAASCDAVNHFDFIFAMLQDSETTQKGLVNFAVPKNPGDRLCHGCPLTP